MSRLNIQQTQNYSFTIKVTGCNDCPFFISYDMQQEADYYGDYCNLKGKVAVIPRTLDNKPQTPDWCPLKGKKCTIKF